MSTEIAPFAVLPGGPLLLAGLLAAALAFPLRRNRLLVAVTVCVAVLCLIPVASGWALAIGSGVAIAILLMLRPGASRAIAICVSVLPGLAAPPLVALASWYGLPAVVPAHATALTVTGAFALAVARGPGLAVGLATGCAALAFTFFTGAETATPVQLQHEERMPL